MNFENELSKTKIPTTRLPKDIPLASAFVPYQFWEEPLPPKEALQQGTMFPELDLPFICHGGANYE